MNEQIRLFNGDIHLKEALKEYIEMYIAQEAMRKLYAREDVTHIADAKELIDKIFQQIEIDYAIPNQPREQTNQAK